MCEVEAKVSAWPPHTFCKRALQAGLGLLVLGGEASKNVGDQGFVGCPGTRGTDNNQSEDNAQLALRIRLLDVVKLLVYLPESKR